MGHRPMYCSNSDGDDCTKENSKVWNFNKSFHGGVKVYVHDTIFPESRQSQSPYAVFRGHVIFMVGCGTEGNVF